MANLFDGFGVFLRFVGVSGVYGLLSFFLGKTSFPQTAMLFKYACLSTAVISTCVLSKRYSSIIGKNRKTGSIPFWSYLIWWPFHVSNHLFALIAKNRKGVDPATEISPNFFVGGWYSYELEVEWEAVIDLTCELPELCRSKIYLNCPTWDGVVNYEDIDIAAKFAAEHSKSGPVLVHCAHGVGRSTTIMRAALVEAGRCEDVNEAFKQIKKKRMVAKSSPRNQVLLDRWQNARKKMS